jgi:hypothetical protein
VFGALAEDEGLDEELKRWQASVSWRYQKSDRHFRGREEEKNRQAENSEVINRIHLAELGLTYRFDRRTSLTVTMPYLMAERSSPMRDADRVVVDRSVTQARGVSDIVVMARRLVWDPREHPASNLTWGIGVKLPTGSPNVHDTRRRIVAGQEVTSVESVDQSIQPGDGGFGVVVELEGYRRFASDRAALYASGTYLINPEGTNGVETYRGRASERYMSIADQYLLRTGVAYSGAAWNGWGASVGLRLEGVPVHDLIGSSDGFRRPGYALSAEPGLTWTRGDHTLALAVPVALERNRQRSVPDLRDGTHGDAAFADYLVTIGYWRRF